jgi:hypothetical protein
MKLNYYLLSFLCLYCFCYSCKNKPSLENQHARVNDSIPPVDNSTPRLNIVWDKTGKKISHEVYFAEYGRIRRLHGDTLLLIYHCGGPGNEWDNIVLRKSYDNGGSWQAPLLVAKDDDPRYYGFSTPDLLVLKNGWLLMAYTGRGKPDDSTHNNIQLCISKDKGQSWSKPAIVSVGRSWEPGMVQLPGNEIELFFSTELSGSRRSQGRPEQRVTLMTSSNNGQSWSMGKEIAFMKGGRDGMPIPLVLKDNKGIVVAIESVHSKKSPYMLWSSMKKKWDYKTLPFEANGRRWFGAAGKLWAGAPYIIQLPSGETVVSVQDTGGRKINRYTDWKKNTMLVMIGNSIAKNFTNVTYPWPNLPVTEGAYFNSLFVKNDSTIVAVSTRNFADKHSEVWIKEGHVRKTRL